MVWVGWMDDWMDGRMGGLVHGWIDDCMDGWEHGWGDGWLDGWMSGWTDGHMGEWVHGWVDRWMDYWMYGWVHGFGLMNGWLDRWYLSIKWWIHVLMDSRLEGLTDWINIWTNRWVTDINGFIICILVISLWPYNGCSVSTISTTQAETGSSDSCFTPNCIPHQSLYLSTKKNFILIPTGLGRLLILPNFSFFLWFISADLHYMGRARHCTVVGSVPCNPEGRRFESHSSRHVGTFGKSFTHSLPVALRRVNSDTVSML